MDVQLLRSADGQTDPVVVPGLAQANGAGNGRDTHDFAVVVFEHEQVVGIGTRGFTTEGFLGPTHAVRQALLVGRQGGQACASAAGQLKQGRQIGAADGTNDHALTP